MTLRKITVDKDVRDVNIYHHSEKKTKHEDKNASNIKLSNNIYKFNKNVTVEELRLPKRITNCIF